MSTPELRTPAEWSALDGVTVMDPDGWRGTRTLPAKSFDEPIDRAEWEQRLSVSSQISPVTRTEASEELSVVDRIALRMLRVQVYGTLREERYDQAARNQWGRVLDEEDRDTWRRVACELLADIALGDNDEMRAWPEYQVLHPEGAVQGGYDDVSDAVNFQERVWPEATCCMTATQGPERAEVVEEGAALLLESAMEFQSLRDIENPDEPVNDGFLEAQARHQMQRLVEAGWRAPGEPSEVEQLTFERDAADQAAHLLTQQLEDLRDDVLGDESLLVPEIVGAAARTMEQLTAEVASLTDQLGCTECRDTGFVFPGWRGRESETGCLNPEVHERCPQGCPPDDAVEAYLNDAADAVKVPGLTAEVKRLTVELGTIRGELADFAQESVPSHVPTLQAVRWLIAENDEQVKHNEELGEENRALCDERDRIRGGLRGMARRVGAHVEIPRAGLFMRTAGDVRRDDVIKLELFDAYIRDQFRVTCVFDDRDRVVQAWRGIGLTVLQVADGAF